MMKTRIFLSGAALSAVILALAACSDSSSSSGGDGSSGPVADAFMVLVTELVASSPDDADSRETDSVTATSPDDSDSISLGS